MLCGNTRFERQSAHNALCELQSAGIIIRNFNSKFENLKNFTILILTTLKIAKNVQCNKFRLIAPAKRVFGDSYQIAYRKLIPAN